MNYTYLLECSDGTLYCGWTNDLEKRVKAHNSGRGAKYTKSRRPVRLVWYETFETKEEALRDLGRLYERMVMRRHTNGGYQHVVDELWKQCEIWNVDLIIMYQNVACKNMATVQGILDDQAREQNRKMIWIEHDLMDPRTVSRRQMRDKVSEYMRTVMHAEPLDPTLVDFEDEICL